MPKIFEMPKGRIAAMRERPVKDFIDEGAGTINVLTVTHEASFAEVIKKITLIENREDAVVVIAHRSETQAIGLIAHYDLLTWIEQTMASGRIAELSQTKAESIANTEFFYVTEDEPLQRAIELMKEKKVVHVVVLNNKEDRHFVGWVTTRSVLRALGRELAEK